MPIKPPKTTGLLTAWLFLALGASAMADAPAPRPELAALFEAARDIARPTVVDGIPDYSAGAIAERRAELSSLRERFDALDPAGWGPADRVDYLLAERRNDLDDASACGTFTTGSSRPPGSRSS